jgi:SAM-dependent methyltransferase
MVYDPSVANNKPNGCQDAFERSFLSQPLEKQIEDCNRYELAPIFLDLFRNRQPVLEAGCGSGRWCAWFYRNGIQSDGVDWSKRLCDRAKAEIPSSSFFACDMQFLPMPNEQYGGLIALGSIEHLIDGPLRALREFHRVLRNDSIAVSRFHMAVLCAER